MPIALVLVLLDITLVYHAARTGHLQPWAFIILMVPGIGALAYIVIELLPELISGPHARQARRRVANRLDRETVPRTGRSARRHRYHCQPRCAGSRVPGARPV